MILRLPLLLAVLLQARLALAQCPSSTFTCRDGSCIPQDWVGDGEADCDDGFDEENPAEALARRTANTTEKSRVKMEQQNNDPFDELATKAPSSTPESSTAETTRVAETRTVCTDEDQTRVNRCVPPLNAWIEDLRQVDFHNVSLLRDEFPQILVSKGCDLVAEYHACIDGVSPECRTSSEVESWEAMEMYACQLLLPAAKEHAKCFALARDPRCVEEPSPVASPTCALVRSVNADIDCVERLRGKECDESAVEVLTPLRSETEHLHAEIQCAAETKPQKQTEAAAEAQVNALRMLVELDSTCSEPDSKDVWAPVKMVICHKRERLTLFRECFEKALEESHCRTELRNHTACGAIDGFNTDVDCAIALLNDVCDVEAQNVIVEIQERLNDDAIVMKCYSDKDASSDVKARVNNDGFELEPQNPKCSSEQENAALVCLVELVELNKQLTQFQSVNFLLEISSGNSSLVNQICLLYDKYEKCLNESVFAQSNGRRCSFNSPLNTLARIGLSPICAPHWRGLLVDNHDCLETISRSPEASTCQTGLQHLGRTVNMMLQGMHGEALLCKSFYLIRGAFDCGERIVQEQCSADAVRDLDQIKNEMTTLGMEEGCPQDEPADLDHIIAQPVINATPMPEIVKAPVAHALPPAVSHTASHAAPAPTPAANAPCDPASQKAFGECVQPLTAFQPHPLAVIKQPKQIAEACVAFRKFQECRREVRCNPLWAKGMAAMFEFACGDGHDAYLEVRQCVRRVTTRTDVRECVNVFSKGAPQQACPSSKQLLACAKPAVEEKCGTAAGAFVSDYVHRFAAAIDPQCRVTAPTAASSIRAVNCSAAETQLVEQCAAPLDDISARLDDLFKGGLQTLLKNVNNLAPIFAQGCALSAEFRRCARPALTSDACVVSSCLIRAGDGICDQPDVATAIDANLGCVFQQVSDQEFGKCLRTTIATLKEFNLDAIRSMLPRFVDCVEPLVRAKCGDVPLRVLRAITSRDVCPVEEKAPSSNATSSSALPAPIQAVQAPICSRESKEKYSACATPFYKKYHFMPLALLNDGTDVDDMCAELSKMTECVERVSACEKKMDAAVRDLMGRLCASREVFDAHKTCLAAASVDEKVVACSANLTSHDCASLAALAECAAPHVHSRCGKEALDFSFSAMNDFARSFSDEPNCSIAVPSVSLETGCSEDDLVDFLQCESHVDHFSFRPVSIVSNASEWNSFCEVVDSKYKPCLAAMKCRFEPVSAANTRLFDSLCGDNSVREKHVRHLQCLNEYLGTPEGHRCLESFAGVDLIDHEAPEKLCSSLTSISSCASADIASRCGADALSHVFNVHSTWAHGFNPKCSLPAPTVTPSTASPSEKKTELSSDAVATTVQPEPEPTPEPTTEEPKAEPEPKPEPTAEPEPSPEPKPEEPKAEPEPEPTAEPTAEPTPEPEPAPKAEDDNRTLVKPTGSSASTVSAALVPVVLVSMLLTL